MPQGEPGVFGFVRMSIVVLGSLLLAIGALNEYVGYGALEEVFLRFPGYFHIRRNPGLAGMVGAVLIIAAFVFPSGGARVDDEWHE